MSLTVQVCQTCGTHQYPRRDICMHCLSDALEEQEVSGQGTVLSWTKGHISVLPAFKDKTPLTLARVKLDGGAVVLALMAGDVTTGDNVVVTLKDGLMKARTAEDTTSV